MYLKEIELENFKSFGRRIAIPFLKGYTAITGPNGSGKSNISDAILFVLGPKSSKAIRAGKLTDLIFNGGKSKKASKFCKVTLIFNNDDRTIPIDNDEVRLTRLVRVSSTVKDNYYSYFYVNGKPSSLTEFENLLAHARISADGYNLVQQGDVNSITKMSPIDRRRMLDDVAGITKFDKDIGRAEDKRKQVEDNLERIGILTDEIKRHLKELDKDRNDAIKYNELREKISHYKVQLAMKKKDNFTLEIKTLEDQIAKYELDKVDNEEKVDEIKRKIGETGTRLTEVENKLADLSGEEAESLKSKIEEIKLNRMRSKDAENNARLDIDDYKREKSTISSDLKTAEKELNQYIKNLEKVEDELNKNKETRDELSKSLKEHEDLASKSDTELMNMKREITKLSQSLETVRENIHQENLDRDRLEERSKRSEEEIDEIEEQIKKYEFEYQENVWHIKELDQPKDDAESVKELEKKINTARKTEQKLLKESLDLEEVVRNLTRQHTQIKLQADHAALVQKGYTHAVQTILDARDSGKLKGIQGTIAELGNVTEKYNNALITAAGGRMQSIVVDDDESAAKAINYLKKNKIGRATFLPLNKMVKGKPGAKALMAEQDDKTIGFAIDLVKFDTKYQPAFWYVFRDTVVVKDLDTARKYMGGVRLVTLEGELIEGSGAMIGGMLPQKTLKFGIPPESEINKISKKLQQATMHSDKIVQELQDIKTEIMELEDNLRKAGFQEDTQSQKKKELESERSLIKEKLANLKTIYDEKCVAKEALTVELTNSANKNKKLAEEFTKLETNRDEKQQIMLKATSKDIADKIKNLQNELADVKEAIHDLTSRRDTLKTQMKLYTEKCETSKKSLEEIENKLKENRDKIDESKKFIADYGEELNKLMKVEKTMSKEQIKLSEERDKLLTREVKLGNELEKLHTKILTTTDIITRTGVQIKDINKELAEVMTELQRYEMKPEDLKDGSIPLDELKRMIPRYESQLESLPPVNLRAIEEFKKQNERLEDLNKEVDQLKTQRDNLNKLVDELKTKKKDGLMTVFKAVNENFKVIFNEISNGGTAELLLDDYKDPFEGGLQIKARPKNKKALKLEALSGGEKSLTALALIFSIQRYQPSPFYVLDEVDMFLDGINAENVGRMISKNTKMAQFIIISLRKVTFKDAAHVYGVTMQGTGISYIVGKVNMTEIGEDGEIMKDLDDAGHPPQKGLPEATGG